MKERKGTPRVKTFLRQMESMRMFRGNLFPPSLPLYDYPSNIKQSPPVPPHLIVEAEKYIKC